MQLSPLSLIEGLEDEAKADFRFPSHQLSLDETNQVLQQVREGFKGDQLHWEAASSLLESATFNGVIGVFEEVERDLRVKRVKQGFVSKFNPFEHLG